MIKKLWIILCVIFIAIMSILPIFAEDKKVIRVGFPIQPGSTEKTNEGEYIGYTVEYLEEISKYTGWEYEFVEASGDLNEQLSTLIEMLQKGEIDIMGTMVYSEALTKVFDYPGYSYGTAYSVLIVRKDDNRWLADDFQNWDNIVVGTYPGLKTRMDELKKFADINGFKFETKEYDTQVEIREALYRGEIDATISVDISMDNQVKEIAHFTPVPYYFAVSKGNQEIVRDLNSALSNINVGNPYLQGTLYTKYFGDNYFSLSNDAKQYIQSLGTLHVLMMDGNAPIQYNSKEGPKGISVSYLEKMKKDLGLSYKITMAKDYDEFLSIIDKQEVDIVTGVSSATNITKDVKMTLSVPYLDSYLVQAVHGEQEVDQTSETIYNTEDILKAVNKGTISNAAVDLYIANFYLQKKGVYKNVTIQSSKSSDLQYSLGLLDSNKSRLLTIINSYLNSFTEQKKQEIVYRNTLVDMEYTLQELLQANLWQIIVFILFLLMILSLLYLRRVRKKNMLLDSEIMQQRRLNELSRLSNECLFEYNYKEDVMHIENNQAMFNQEHIIENYSSYDQHIFLRKMILDEKDDNYDFQLKINGQLRWYRVQLRVLKNDDGKATYALGRIVDIHDQLMHQKELIERSQKDNLTGLLNRSAANELVKKCIEENNQGILIIFDIDNFKQVNDRKGHPVGDALLQKFAEYLSLFFRKEDIISRLGGDEFLVFIPVNISFDSLKSKLCRFIEKVNHDIFLQYEEEDVSVSIGTAQVIGKNDSFEELYGRADHAMYITKLGGKNGFFISDETDCPDEDCINCEKNCRKKWYYKHQQHMKEEEVS